MNEITEGHVVGEGVGFPSAAERMSVVELPLFGEKAVDGHELAFNEVG